MTCLKTKDVILKYINIPVIFLEIKDLADTWQKKIRRCGIPEIEKAIFQRTNSGISKMGKTHIVQ